MVTSTVLRQCSTPTQRPMSFDTGSGAWMWTSLPVMRANLTGRMPRAGRPPKMFCSKMIYEQWLHSTPMNLSDFGKTAAPFNCLWDNWLFESLTWAWMIGIWADGHGRNFRDKMVTLPALCPFMFPVRVTERKRCTNNMVANYARMAS
jgi:hypothetical protein